MADLRELAGAALRAWEKLCEAAYLGTDDDRQSEIITSNAARDALFVAIDRQAAEREALERVAQEAETMRRFLAAMDFFSDDLYQHAGRLEINFDRLAKALDALGARNDRQAADAALGSAIRRLLAASPTMRLRTLKDADAVQVSLASGHDAIEHTLDAAVDALAARITADTEARDD